MNCTLEFISWNSHLWIHGITFNTDNTFKLKAKVMVAFHNMELVESQ
jgi:hypothetical protein